MGLNDKRSAVRTARHQNILGLVEQRGQFSVSDVETMFGVCRATAENDIRWLGKHERVIPVRGGIQAIWKGRPAPTKADLIRQYAGTGLTMREVAGLVGCSQGTVKAVFRLLNRKPRIDAMERRMRVMEDRLAALCLRRPSDVK